MKITPIIVSVVVGLSLLTLSLSVYSFTMNHEYDTVLTTYKYGKNEIKNGTVFTIKFNSTDSQTVFGDADEICSKWWTSPISLFCLESKNYDLESFKMNCDKIDGYSYCLDSLDVNKIKQMTKTCNDANYPFYDLSKDRCFYLGYRTELLDETNIDAGKEIMIDGRKYVKIKDVRLFASATETHPELAAIAKMNCNNNGGAWLDDACWIKAPEDENYCSTLVIGYGQLWRDLEDPTNEVCYGDDYLDELWSQMKK